MTYFTAVLAAAAPDAGTPRDWRAVDVDLDEVDDVDALSDALGDAADSVDAGSLVIAVLEREDEWFALARQGDDGLRVFVSDLEAASTSRFAELLADAASTVDRGGPAADDEDDVPGVDDGEDDGEDDGGAEPVDGPDDDGPSPAVAGPSWAGDAAVLADVGVAAEELVETSETHDPATALAVVGERVGFVDLLEALR
jgi:putative tRNA adenosine deaminase-associated protein